MLCISSAYAVVQYGPTVCLSVTFVHCVEKAKDAAIIAVEYE